MWNTCKYLLHTPTMIQLRHVPDALHRQLKARAALAGLSPVAFHSRFQSVDSNVRETQ